MSSTGTNTNQGTTNSPSSDEHSINNGKNASVNRKKSEWVTIELLVPFDVDLTRKIKMRRDDTFGHLVNRWQLETGSNVRLPLVIHTEDGVKFVRETNTPNDLKNVYYGNMVVFDLGPPDCYFDDSDSD